MFLYFMYISGIDNTTLTHYNSIRLVKCSLWKWYQKIVEIQVNIINREILTSFHQENYQ